MGVSLSFLSPVGALLALAAFVPLAALGTVRRSAARLRLKLGVPEPPVRRLIPAVTALLAAGSLIGVAAAQPVIARTTIRHVRSDAEVFIVLDVSRSMLARRRLGSATRFERAKSTAGRLRISLRGVPVGIASITDRTLPHLFPSADEDVFKATLERSVGIDRPPPRGIYTTSATKLDAIAAVRNRRFFSPAAKRRVIVILTDGETQPVAGARLGALLRRPPPIDTLFIQFWQADERVFTLGVPEPGYRSDPSARALLDSIAASIGGSVYTERDVGAATRKARELVGSGPTVVTGTSERRLALAPFLILGALLPLGLLLQKRDR
jgi:hypothetical protein